MKDLEEYLRENKPIVKDNPTFILETRHRMESVEGIKGEVDRQRRSGRRALIIALVAGLVAGILVAAVAFFYPVDPESVGQGILQSIRLFLQEYRQYLLLPVALLAIALAIVLFPGRRSWSV